MKKAIISAAAIAVALVSNVSSARASELTEGFTVGKPDIQSIASVDFAPEGILLVGDSKGGAVYAIATGDIAANDSKEGISVTDIEGKIAALLGTTADQILIHDLAVNPISQNAYISASRGRGKWESRWQLPNDLEDARLIVRIKPDGSMDEFALDNVNFARAAMPNPVDMNKAHKWKKETRLRTDAITDVAYSDGTIYVSGLSNEEFASALWQIPFPFGKDTVYSTLEIFHGAHGEFETHAPIRTFLPYALDGKPYILASYLCTPLVTFPLGDLKAGQHVKGTTVAEFGSGNYPLDMVLCRFGGKEFVVMSNSMLPLMTFDPNDVSKQIPITEEVPTYIAGLPYTPRAGSGVQQLAPLNSEFVLALQRMPNGNLDVVSISIERLAL